MIAGGQLPEKTSAPIVLISYVSWSGDVGRLARFIRRDLEPDFRIEWAPIRPVHSRGYAGWLARSFIPGWRERIRPVIIDLSRFDLVCLGFPKWTLSCPPLNEYLQLLERPQGKPFALFMSYGGFDEERYFRGIRRKIERAGAQVCCTTKVRRSALREGQHAASVTLFCDCIRRRLIDS